MRSLTALLSGLLTASSAAYATPPNTPVDPETRQWYQGLKNNQTGGSCCDVADCRPTDFRPDPSDNLRWQAYISKTIYGPDAPDAWVTVPPQRLLQQHDNPTGRMVVCWYNHMIYCAVLPSLT